MDQKEEEVMKPQNTELLILQKSVDAREDEIHLLQDFIREFGEEKATLQGMVMAADKRLEIVKIQRDEYDRQVEDFKNALSNRDHEFSELKKKLDKAEKAVIYLTKLSDDVKDECVKTQQGLYKTAKELAEVNKILDKAQNQLRLTIETMAAFRKSTPSEKSFVALMKALEKNFGLESRDIGKSKKKKK